MKDPQAEALRLFVAAPAPPAVQEAARETIAALRGAGDVRWVGPERLHLTLKFLGNTDVEKVPLLRRVFAETANNFSPFVVSLGGVGAFPNVRKPQTLWLGFQGEAAPLIRLARGVEGAAASLGFPPEGRPFRAHLTLGRVRSAQGAAELGRRVAEAAARPDGASWGVEWPVFEFHLVRSDLRPSGPEYTVLERFPLGEEE
jgi:2'-5' RNA ligase